MRNLQSLSSLSAAVLPLFGATAFPVFTTTMKTVSAFSLQQQQQQQQESFRRSRSHPSRSWMAAAAMDPVPPLQQASTITAVPSLVADLPPSTAAAAAAAAFVTSAESKPALVAPPNKSLRHALVCYVVTRKCVVSTYGPPNSIIAATQLTHHGVFVSVESTPESYRSNNRQ